MKFSDADKLMRQRLSACLQPFSMVSVPAVDSEGRTMPKFLQVLALESKPILVKTLNVEEERGLYNISAQPYERWCPVADERHRVGDEADVFAVEDPTALDVIQLCGGSKIGSRCGWQEWDTKPSDVDGCVACFRPRALAPKVALGHSSAPILSLLDELARRRFRPVHRLVVHKPGCPPELDARKLPGKRYYLQAVLILDELFQCGLDSMPSDCIQLYYQVLLKTRKPVAPHQPAKAYKAMLPETYGDIIIEATRAPEKSAAEGRGVKRPAPANVPDDVAGGEVDDADGSERGDSSSSSSQADQGDDNIVGDDAAVDGDAELQAERQETGRLRTEVRQLKAAAREAETTAELRCRSQEKEAAAHFGSIASEAERRAKVAEAQRDDACEEAAQLPLVRRYSELKKLAIAGLQALLGRC